jgi:hypothetical protein
MYSRRVPEQGPGKPVEFAATNTPLLSNRG